VHILGYMLLSVFMALFLGRRRYLRLAGCLPFIWYGVSYRLRPGDPWQEWVLGVAQSTAMCGWSLLLFSLSGSLLCALSRGWLQAPGLRWLSLSPWGLLLQFHLRSGAADPGLVGKFYVRACWDPPLVWTARLARIAGLRLLRPFHSDIDSEITVGSLPMAQDVPWLHMHDVAGVVNMCAEWAGPQTEYARFGIKQIQLPTVDTSSPSLKALVMGVQFINQTLAAAPGKRIFIHCKAGMGRAATMALSWYISQGLAPDTAMDLLETSRPIVQRKVLDYPAVKELQRIVAGWSTAPRRRPATSDGGSLPVASGEAHAGDPGQPTSGERQVQDEL